MTLTGKTALITGASRGIGGATAILFAEHGARVALHYHRNENAARMTLSTMQGEGHVLLQADLSDSGEAQRTVDRALGNLGRIDVVVNNAGIFAPHPVDTTTYAQWLDAWRQTVATNLFGAANVSYCAARSMITAGGGRIINITSRGAFRGEPDAPAYGASKAGMNAMSQSMAKALAPHKIFVFAIAPGWVNTDMAEPYLSGPAAGDVLQQSPLQRVATPEEIAKIALYLASDAPEYMTGCIIDANGASYLRT